MQSSLAIIFISICTQKEEEKEEIQTTFLRMNSVTTISCCICTLQISYVRSQGQKQCTVQWSNITPPPLL